MSWCRPAQALDFQEERASYWTRGAGERGAAGAPHVSISGVVLPHV